MELNLKLEASESQQVVSVEFVPSDPGYRAVPDEDVRLWTADLAASGDRVASRALSLMEGRRWEAMGCYLPNVRLYRDGTF